MAYLLDPEDSAPLPISQVYNCHPDTATAKPENTLICPAASLQQPLKFPANTSRIDVFQQLTPVTVKISLLAGNSAGGVSKAL
jgi:hypothetical protein